MEFRTGNPTDTIARRALEPGTALGKGSPPQPGGTAWPHWPQCPGCSQYPSTPQCITVTLPYQGDVHSWDGRFSPECQSQTITDLVLQSKWGRHWHKHQGNSVEQFNTSIQPICSKNKHGMLILEARPTTGNKPRWYKFAFTQMRPSLFTYLHLLFWGQLLVFNTHTLFEKQTPTIWG